MYAWPSWPLPLTPGRGQCCDTNVARALTHIGTTSGGDTSTRRRQPRAQPKRRHPRQPPPKNILTTADDSNPESPGAWVVLT